MFSFLPILIAQAGAGNSLQLGENPIRGAGVVGDLTTNVADSPEGAITLLLGQISLIIGFLTLLGGLFFVLYFIIAAFDWLRAGGDQGAVEKAQKKMTNAAIGLLIMIVAIGIIGIVGGVFGLDILNPADIYVDLVTNRGGN